LYNQHTRGIATTRHRRLVERGGRRAFVRDKGLAHTHKRKEKKKGKMKREKWSGKIDVHESTKKEFEHIELPAKLLDYFSRSIKSHINQMQKSNV